LDFNKIGAGIASEGMKFRGKRNAAEANVRSAAEMKADTAR